jgi:hypothetical protein
MAAKNKWPVYAQPVSVSATADTEENTQAESPTEFDGGDGGGTVDAETKNYLDAKVDAVKSQNDARFAEVLSRLDTVNASVQHMEPVSIWKIASLVAAGVFAIAGLLGVMADRFDGGVAASGLVSAWQSAQFDKDAAQDARLTEQSGKIDAVGSKVDTVIDLVTQLGKTSE